MAQWHWHARRSPVGGRVPFDQGTTATMLVMLAFAIAFVFLTIGGFLIAARFAM